MKQKINCNWYKYVDLGLPSGLLWATCNVGANEPWENGLYFSWGNVDGHAHVSGYYFCETDYDATPGASLNGNIPVDAGYDAARANLGGSWRLPTEAEFCELCDNCTSEWVTQNDVNGRLFTSKINCNSVFFPAAGGYYGTVFIGSAASGAYWSSSLHSRLNACCLYVGCGGFTIHSYSLRFIGYTVRAVLDHPKDSLLIKTIKR